MSEYQYYEFRAIDRPLGQDEMDELRRLSSRAQITATSFTNTYNYGDFRGKPSEVLERYFDAFVHVANWGTHQVAFRIPKGLFDLDAAEVYGFDEGEFYLSISEGEEHAAIDFLSQEEGGDWEEGGERWMSSLLPIRDDLMRGDLRALYIGWLASISYRGPEEDEAEDELEPPVPPGLAKLTGPLKTLAEFLRIDGDLIEVAAAGSTGEAVTPPSRADMARWIRSLPIAEKDDYLAQLLAGDGEMRIRAELARRFREATAPRSKKGHAPKTGRRTVRELLVARDALASEKARKKAEKDVRERARLDRERAEARARHLDELAKREPAAWKQVEELIAASKPKEYDEAVQLLVDLRDLAARSGRTDEALARIREIRERNTRRSSLMKKFDGRKLGG
ncbi:hypothetical protein OJF2_70010 [Aquisphaera giovannonii]|uniref:Uncharacterized protein n=1 Tax=Aquisphaera giovannonii TaxID=406548 RepID=A0A5B9WEU0_9BACT|nr:hypothetical protein [Aquisphaera giovannonii]QEH38400.1 hypothetical protein OJF2_70010 [Aquisphaera giovannonii]